MSSPKLQEKEPLATVEVYKHRKLWSAASLVMMIHCMCLIVKSQKKVTMLNRKLKVSVRWKISLKNEDIDNEREWCEVIGSKSHNFDRDQAEVATPDFVLDADATSLLEFYRLFVDSNVKQCTVNETNLHSLQNPQLR